MSQLCDDRTEYLIVFNVAISFKKHPVTTQRATHILIEGKSCNLLLYIRRYLKSVLRHFFFFKNLVACHPETAYLLE